MAGMVTIEAVPASSQRWRAASLMSPASGMAADAQPQNERMGESTATRGKPSGKASRCGDGTDQPSDALFRCQPVAK
jgi:hypothetical protein